LFSPGLSLLVVGVVVAVVVLSIATNDNITTMIEHQPNNQEEIIATVVANHPVNDGDGGIDDNDYAYDDFQYGNNGQQPDKESSNPLVDQ
jgi:hypothetical protein